QRQEAESRKTETESFPVFECGFQQLPVAAAESFKPALESALPFSYKASWLGHAVLMSAHDKHHHGRDQGTRQQIRRQHGKAHGLGQRNEKKPCDSGEKKHRHKYDADTQRRYERGHG